MLAYELQLRGAKDHVKAQKTLNKDIEVNDERPLRSAEAKTGRNTVNSVAG
jgi:hypothetical protein